MPDALAVPAPAATRERLRGAAVLSLGTALPERAVTSALIGARMGVRDDWVESRTGIAERRVASDGDSLTELAAEAGRRALVAADADPADVDLVLVATFTPDEHLPNAAPLVAHALGAPRAGAFDVGAACTGFLTALGVATAQVEARRADLVLVVGADLTTRVVDPHDRATAAVFGDGAGAVLVGPAPAPGMIGPLILRSDATGAPYIRIGRDDGLIRMDGHETFKAAIARMAEVTLEALEAAELEVADVDLFVYHQANARILAGVGDRLGLPPERVVNAIGTLGNTSAASLPLALESAAPWPGARVLLGAFGAGFTWGAATLAWGGPDA
jgi:3-oxoacyl-[acyl-carrier-protein] synthase-3